jgi:hypothetical protein
MNWSRFLKVFLGNIVIGATLATLALGAFGFAVGGTEGLVNGAIWGAALGIVGGAMSGFVWAGKYWSDFAGRYSSAWLREETEGKQGQAGPGGRDSSW